MKKTRPRLSLESTRLFAHSAITPAIRLNREKPREPNFMRDHRAYVFSADSGIGLPFLRMGIANGGTLNGGAFSDAIKAAARGARVWAAAWTAPAAWNDNGTTNNGGHLCAAPAQGVCTASHYDDWAARLAGFAATLKQNASVDLYALSVQNEPDCVATCDSMIVADSEFVAFANTLAPKLACLRHDRN